MKKLLFILGLLISAPASANIITVQPFSGDSSVSHMENFRGTVVTAINGNIAGGSGGTSTVNILADSIGEIELANDANPRVRDSELFGITVDTISGGAIASQGTVVESGCIQATDTDLTADVSACVVYVNGYRVSKGATAQTYANSSTTYLWISDTGNYTQSTNPNTNIANSSLLSVVTTAGGQITAVSNLFTTRVPGLIVPVAYRLGNVISRDSTTTITVQPGSLEVNSAIINKTTPTTLTISTAGDWAGGSSLRATSTMAFVGMDASGNLKMHTTAPTHDNYALTAALGKKRYATWSSTVYRVIGWFFMNATSGGELDTWGVSNLKEGDVANRVIRTNATVDAVNDTSYGTDLTGTQVQFYSSGGPLEIRFSALETSGVGANIFTIISDDSGTGNIADTERGGIFSGSTGNPLTLTNQWVRTYPQRNNTILARMRVASSAASVATKSMIVDEG